MIQQKDREAAMEQKINTIGIDNNLNYPRILKLLRIGLFAAVLATTGDVILGYGRYDSETADIFSYFFSLYRNLSDGRILASEFMGLVGTILEVLCLFGIYRLMADGSLKLAHAFRTGIFGCLVFGPCGYHVAFTAMFFTYKNLYRMGGVELAAEIMYPYVSYFILVPVGLYFVSVLILTIAQMKAFGRGLTPLPKWCAVFLALPAAVIVYIVSAMIGNYPVINAIATAWIHLGYLWMYGGLLTVCKRTVRSKK